MSLWGKVLGGAIGFGFGGPIGALLGAVAGHLAIDKRAQTDGGDPLAGGARGDEERRMAFAVAVIALAAKLAKADGHVSRDEVTAIKQVFHIPGADEKAVGAIFNEARREAAGFEPYARQIAGILDDHRQLREELLAALVMIAHADGEYHPREREFLRRVGVLFGFGESEFRRIEATFAGSVEREESDPYEVLGLTAQAGDAEIRTAYRKLVREYHPDRMISHGLPREFVEVADKKMAEVNAAYDRIKKQRGQG